MGLLLAAPARVEGETAALSARSGNTIGNSASINIINSSNSSNSSNNNTKLAMFSLRASAAAASRLSGDGVTKAWLRMPGLGVDLCATLLGSDANVASLRSGSDGVGDVGNGGAHMSSSNNSNNNNKNNNNNNNNNSGGIFNAGTGADNNLFGDGRGLDSLRISSGDGHGNQTESFGDNNGDNEWELVEDPGDTDATSPFLLDEVDLTALLEQSPYLSAFRACFSAVERCAARCEAAAAAVDDECRLWVAREESGRGVGTGRGAELFAAAAERGVASVEACSRAALATHAAVPQSLARLLGMSSHLSVCVRVWV